MLPHTSNAEHPQDRGSAGSSLQLLTTSSGAVERSPKRAELTTSNPQPIMGKHKKSAKPGSVSPPSFESDKSPRGKNPSKQAEFQQLFNLDDEVIEGKVSIQSCLSQISDPCLLSYKSSSDYSCAYQGDAILYHGRMYISRNHICFHSQIFKKTIVRTPTFLSLPLVG